MRGDYIWFVDADDFIQDNALYELQTFAETGHYDRIIFGAYEFHEALTAEETETKARGTICANTGANTMAVWASLFNREFLAENGLAFEEGLTLSEDALFLYELSLHHPIQASLHQVLYFWRRNLKSTTMSENKVALQKKMESLLRFVTRMDEYYRSRQGDLSMCANSLMTNLWWYLLCAAKLDRKSCHTAFRRATEKRLFPYHRPPECTLRKTYMTTRVDLLGKTIDYVGTHLHRRWGFAAMRIYYLLWHKREQ